MSGILRRGITLQRCVSSGSGWFSTSPLTRSSQDDVTHFPDKPTITIPIYTPPPDEPLEQKRARLMYQSRKRGMLENDLLLSSFASRYLKNMNQQQLETYDRLINSVSNEWTLYYWITEKDPTPEEYDNDVMKLLKKHVSNSNRDSRSRQPDLY